uniref:Oxygen sensor histidine kinase NreB n=1 Tax=Desulfobacca acetoxidans TaxID=60893 RepID=A0A7V6A582_9BACT
MRIKTRVKVAGALTVCVLLAYGAMVLHLDRSLSNLIRDVQRANELVDKITILRSLTQDYLLYPTERSTQQWSVAYAEVLQFLDKPDFQRLKRTYGLGDVPAKLKVVGDTFSRLMEIRTAPGPDSVAGEAQKRLATQVLLATHDLLTWFIQVTAEANRKLIYTHRLISSLDFLALLVLGLLVVSNIVFLQRSVVKPIVRLHDGVEKIGAGDLDYRVGIDSRDEIGQLSRAFDLMTANLKSLTVSLKKSEERLRGLTAKILSVQEEERGRLARELHDDLGQSLLVLRMQLSAILRRYSPEPALQEKLQEAISYLKEIIDKTRRLSQDLSPSILENLGLAEALRNLFEDFQRHREHDMVIKAEMDEVKHLLPKEANIAIYRIAQEFLANVHKHAEASQVDVAIKALPDKVSVTLEDNGKGFDLEEIKSRPKERRGMGVASMEERLRMLGSQFSLSSQPGKGTRLYFEIPYTGQKPPGIQEMP